MTITKTQLARRVALWQKRLERAGVAHWELRDLLIVPREEMPLGPSVAAVHLPNDYDIFALHFSRESLDEMENQRQLDETIVHELVHVAMRSFDLAVSSAEDEFSPAAANEWNYRVKHERERFVDGIARAFVAAYY